ncbi:unnamed protein product [Staurois parvus]|uniref:Uncharacterized protein n=1 Tax=Staurois parvus TaxID=386267 RepID=A0ABN9EU63_9NEOB|nr:unnamed protein product [Staurois parvus]
MYTDHQGTADQCALVISVAPAVPAVGAHQCHINATYQCLSVYINATYQCPSELPFSVTYQCHLSMPVQCHLSVLPISTTYQCQSMSLISASQCHL